MRITYFYLHDQRMRPFSNGNAHSTRIGDFVVVVFYDERIVPHAYVYSFEHKEWYECEPFTAFEFVKANAVDTNKLKPVPVGRLVQRYYLFVGMGFRLVAPRDLPLDAIVRFQIGEKILCNGHPWTVIGPALVNMRRVAVIGELPYESLQNDVEFVPTAIFHNLVSEGDALRFSKEHVLAASMFLDGFTWTPDRDTVLSKVFDDDDRFIVTDGKTTFATHGQVAIIAKNGSVWVTKAVSMNEALHKLSRRFYEWPRRMSWFETFADRQGIHVIACRLTMYGSTHGHIDALETIKRYATRTTTPYRLDYRGERIDVEPFVHIDIKSGAVLFTDEVEP